MIPSPRRVGWVGSAFVFLLGGPPLHAQMDFTSAAEDESAQQAVGVACQPQCVGCWLGTAFEQDCPGDYFDDGFCDCACQFADNSDCGSSCSCPQACVWCWCNTTAQGACPTSWNGDGECDCACQFADSDCPTTTPTGACCAPSGSCNVTTSASCSSSGGTYRGNNVTCAQANCTSPTGACCSAQDGCSVTTAAACAGAIGAYQGNGTVCGPTICAQRCDAICEYCWSDTPYDGDCDPLWEGDGSCDCGCQFSDPDCGPTGACCVPADGLCGPLTETTCRFYYAGVFRGVGIDCAAADCDRCDPGCAWCWVDTIAEHACLPAWAGDTECDCGCQFADPDCAGGVCGNLVCEESATSCSLDCTDLRAFAEFQNCFRPGQSTPPACVSHIYAAPVGIGPEDFARFFDLLSGP